MNVTPLKSTDKLPTTTQPLNQSQQQTSPENHSADKTKQIPPISLENEMHDD